MYNRKMLKLQNTNWIQAQYYFQNAWNETTCDLGVEAGGTVFPGGNFHSKLKSYSV